MVGRVTSTETSVGPGAAGQGRPLILIMPRPIGSCENVRTGMSCSERRDRGGGGMSSVVGGAGDIGRARKGGHVVQVKK